jgi:hypothetical protein
VLYLEDGEPADPATFVTAEPRWDVGDVFMSAGGRRWRILEMEPSQDAAGMFDAVWTVEPFPG